MTDWAINLPVRSPDDPVTQLGFDARHLDGEDAAVCREIATVGLLAGARTVGDVEWIFQHMDPSTRKWALSRLRQRAGLASIEQLEARERAEMATLAGPRHTHLHLARSGALRETTDPP